MAARVAGAWLCGDEMTSLAIPKHPRSRSGPEMVQKAHRSGTCASLLRRQPHSSHGWRARAAGLLYHPIQKILQRKRPRDAMAAGWWSRRNRPSAPIAPAPGRWHCSKSTNPSLSRKPRGISGSRRVVCCQHLLPRHVLRHGKGLSARDSRYLRQPRIRGAARLATAGGGASGAALLSGLYPAGKSNPGRPWPQVLRERPTLSRSIQTWQPRLLSAPASRSEVAFPKSAGGASRIWQRFRV
jgi:hypothetical protein